MPVVAAMVVATVSSFCASSPCRSAMLSSMNSANSVWLNTWPFLSIQRLASGVSRAVNTAR
ncbi:hypothetical protein D3C87_2017260 [compost metagenome]